MKESKVIVDLHRIRERHFDETKGMSSDEFLAKLKEEVAPIKSRLLKTKKIKSEPHRT